MAAVEEVPRRPVGRLSAEERAQAVERVLAGETQTAVAASVGLSRERVRQLVSAYQRAEAAEIEREAARDLDAAALLFRYRQGLAVVESLEPAQRVELLAAVIWPGDELLELSRALALGGLPARKVARTCAGCGCDVADITEGCRTCQERRLGRAKRERRRAARCALEGKAAKDATPSMRAT